MKSYRRKLSPEMYLYNSAKHNAYRRGTDSSLRPEDIVIPKVCPVFGIPLYRQKGARSDNSPSIDRLDNTKGYTKDNIWIISWKANKLKGEGSLQELEALVAAMRRQMGLPI